ncbi:YfiT family bacillithiol transferase [Sphingobacterium yanglingense]|uniref:DinB family protein n=1 Tax=Sphingobacterium yanglingense TaxID=1437280 RepID=A0A4R6WDT7_9SPHI|nr:putative metal-dependent hydrolase [Sphingobacterium yanglingense]TDQ77893.1 DinB family protein [Sphingobacterium yanglingense]
MMEDVEKLKYPIGRFVRPEVITVVDLKEWIAILEAFPDLIQKEVKSLSYQALNNRYRPGGWTIRQVVHHCADSHINSFVRFKLALTEEKPTIKPYNEAMWAELIDAQDMPIDSSLAIIKGIHQRWVVLLKSLSIKDLQRTFIHPETKEEISLQTNIGIYAWHCQHHLNHIVNAKNSAYSS